MGILDIDNIDDDFGILEEYDITPYTNIKTKSFRRFFLEQQLRESPYQVPFNKNQYQQFNNDYSNIEFAKLLKHKYIDSKIQKLKFNVHNIDLFHIKEKEYQYYFLVNQFDNVVGYVRFKPILNGIQTNGLWGKALFARGIISWFFQTYVIPNYNLIISDNYMTPDGEKFWKSLCDYALKQNLEIGIYNNENKQFKTTNDIEKAWFGINKNNLSIYIRRNNVT